MRLSQPTTTVSNASTRALLRLCRGRNFDASGILSEERIPQRTLEDPRARLRSDQMFTIWERAQSQIHDDAIGLHAAELVPFGWYDVLDYLLITSSSLVDGLEKAARFFHLGNGGADLNLRMGRNLLFVELHNSNAPQEHFQRSVEYTLAVILLRMRFTTATNLNPKEVHFTFSEPKDISAYRRIFQAPLRFDQPVDQLVLDQSLLNLPQSGTDPSLNEVLEHQAQLRMRQLPDENDFIRQVRVSLDARLGREAVTISLIAKDLAISVRSLQRKLNSQGTSFREVLDQARCEIVRGYLREGELDVREAAFGLGFSEPSAFYRAFKRWTGKTPQQYRDCQATVPPPVRTRIKA